MSRGPSLGARRTRPAVALALALAGASTWVVACSAGVDTYHLEKRSSAGKGGASTSAGGGGGSAPEMGGNTGDGGSGGSGNDGSGGAGNGDSGGNAGNGGSKPSNGGRGAGGATQTTTGGATSSGGTGDGGVGTGGANAGGSGNGGKSAGGTGNGGTGAGGVGTGGAGTGGTGAGGVTTIGPKDPVAVTLSANLTNITAAAWDASNELFFLLNASTKQFYEVTPAGAVSAPRALPSTGTVAPLAFAASAQWVYAIVNGKAYRVAHGGWTAETGVAITPANNAGLAYAGGYVMVGDFANGGTRNAQVFDSNWSLTTAANALGPVFVVAGDGSSFAFTKQDANGSVPGMKLHAAPAGTFAPNTKPCNAGLFSVSARPVSILGSTVAWSVLASSSQLITFATVSAGVCTPVTSDVQYGNGTGALPVALIDSTHAVVVDRLFQSNAELEILSIQGVSTNPIDVPVSTDNVTSIVAGPPHYAVIVSGNVPSLLRF